MFYVLLEQYFRQQLKNFTGLHTNYVIIYFVTGRITRSLGKYERKNYL